MKKHIIANNIALSLLDDSIGYFAELKPYIVNGVPQLAYSKILGKNKERFLYFTEGKNKKLFIQIDIDGDFSYSSYRPGFELGNYHYDIANNFLKSYPLYLSPSESLKQFIINDLPKLKHYNRDKEINIICYDNIQRSSIGHFGLDNEFIKILANSGLSINYTIILQ